MRKGKLIGRIFAIALVFVMIGAMLPLLGAFGSQSQVEASPATIYVPDDYPTIQAAVDAASPGDTIIVRDGTYTENVDVNKAHLTIRSEHGADVTIVQAANPDDHVFEVTADYVEIIGFTLKKAIGYMARTAGIYLGSANYCNISNNIASDNMYGIYLTDSSNNTLTSNNANSNGNDGIYLYESSNNTLTSNKVSNNTVGIELVYSSDNRLTNNTAWNNDYVGIYVGGSDNNTLTNNTASSNEYGIYLSCSGNNTFISNIMSDNDYNFFVWGTHYTQNIDTSNLVDGKPIYYWVNQQDKQIPNDAGFVGIVNCTNITVRDLTLTNNGEGVLFAYTTNSRIENVTASDNLYGIFLVISSNNTLRGNNANSNESGIRLARSDNNTLTNNTASNNLYGYGIWLRLSDNNTLTSNTASNNGVGIALWDGSSNTLTSNKVSNNTVGIGLEYSVNNSLTNNTASNNDYWGIWLRGSSNNNLTDNTASNNDWGGILLESSSDNNTITSNKVSNNGVGIELRYSSNNVIYLNDFIDNSNNVDSYHSTNIWNSAEEITYTYDGNTYTSYLGNHWGDYTGSDADGDGIGDTPYPIDSDRDNYPLVQPFENYAAGLDISVVLQGGSRPPEGWEVPITIKFFSPGADVMSDTPIEQFDLITAKSDSTAVCQCTVAPGTYDITAVSEHTLMNVKRDVVISTPSTAVDMGTLLEGNANDDIIINISDFGILAVSYMKMDGEPGYDARADFDRNGIINIADFGLLAVNYMKMSPIDVSG